MDNRKIVNLLWSTSIKKIHPSNFETHFKPWTSQPNLITDNIELYNFSLYTNFNFVIHREKKKYNDSLGRLRIKENFERLTSKSIKFF